MTEVPTSFRTTTYTDKHVVCRLDNDLVFPPDSPVPDSTPTGHTLTATGDGDGEQQIPDPFGGSSASAHYSRGQEAGWTGVSEDFLPGTLYTIRGWAYVDSLSRFNRACLYRHSREQRQIRTL